MPKIKIIRVWSFTDSIIRNYKVMIDDIYIRKIKFGETIELDVAPGKHTIYLYINWCKSNELDFTINENETKEFACGSFLNGIDICFFALSLGIEALLFRTYLRDICLLIRPIDDENKDNKEEIESAFRALEKMPTLRRKYYAVTFPLATIYTAIMGLLHLLSSYEFHERVISFCILVGSALIALSWYWLDVELKKKEKMK